MHQSINHLLTEVRIRNTALTEARKLFSKQLAPEFRLFDYLQRDEMGLSRCLAALLDPKGTHGQGSVFLDAFLERFFPDESFRAVSQDCSVRTEKIANGQRRIDIYLESPSFIIGIENKPWAADQDGQLRDYAEFLTKESRGKKWMLIYLSNRASSDRSISPDERDKLICAGNLVEKSFIEIEDWLSVVASKAQALTVRIFIEEMSKFIRSNINGEPEMSFEQETASVIQSRPENINAAFQVFAAMDSVKQTLLKKLKDDLLTDFDLKRLGFTLVWDEGLSETRAALWSGFGVRFQDNQRLYLRFEFSRAGLEDLIWGIGRESEAVATDAAQWADIRQVMVKRFGTGKNSPGWPWYSSDPSAGLDVNVDIKNWCKNEGPWVMIYSGEMSRKIIKLAIVVSEAFRGEARIDSLS